MENPDSETKEQKYNPKMDGSLGTIMRIQDTLNRLNYYKRTKDYMNLFLELDVFADDVSPMTRKLDKEGKIIDTKESEKANDLRKICLDLLNKAHNKDSSGNTRFNATYELAEALRNYEIYLKEIAQKYNLYMRQYDEENDNGILARRPRLNMSGRY